MIKTLITFCPFCGNEHAITLNGETNEYHCPSCEFDFTEEEFFHEILRHRISAFCMDTSEQNPIYCDGITIGDDDAMGIGELNKPMLISIFQDYEGILWGNIYGYSLAMELDYFSNNDLNKILTWLEENQK